MSSSVDGGPTPKRREAKSRRTSTPRRELPTPRQTRELSSGVLMLIIGLLAHLGGPFLCLGESCLHLGELESFSYRFFLLALVLPSFQLAFLSLDFPSYSAKHCRMGD